MENTTEAVAAPVTLEHYSQLLKSFAALTADRDKLEVELAEIRRKRRTIERQLLDLMVSKGSDTERIEEGTVSIRRTLWASSAGDGVELVNALQEAGLEEFLTYSPQRVSAWVREIEKDSDEPTARLERLRQALPVLEEGTGDSGFGRSIRISGVPEKLSNCLRVVEKFQLTLLRR